MKVKSEIKQAALLVVIIAIIISLLFSLERSEINNITQVKISGNVYLSVEKYLRFAGLDDKEKLSELTITIIRDRLEKHPYIKNVDAVIAERGAAEIEIFEKKFDAVLLNKQDNYLITDGAEIIPLISSTRNINLPVIVNSHDTKAINSFGNARKLSNLFCALKIISTAELYDKNLYMRLSEINIHNNNDISLLLTNLSSPIYFGNGYEVEKTVFLSKIFKRLSGNDLSNYLDYVDLRYDEMVYLGFDEQLTSDKGKI